MYDGRAVSNEDFLIFMKGGYSFGRFNCNRELIPGCWRSHRDSTALEISEKCSRLTISSGMALVEYKGCGIVTSLN